MLKGISKNLSPELLKILAEMGHGDEIVIADGNFPAASNAKRLIRADGLNVPPLLDDILSLFPRDTAVPHPVTLMEVAPNTAEPAILDTYRQIVAKHEPTAKITAVERFAFYERARNAYAVLATSEAALRANIILCKGVVK